MKKLFAVIVIVFATFHFSYSQSAPAAKTLQPAKPEAAGFSSERLARIDSNINQWVATGRTNGVVTMIVRNGKIVYHKAFGYDDPEKTIPLRPDHIFRIASQTKAITSVAVMMLFEEGKFLLDDPVSRYLPEFAKPQVLDSFIARDSSYTTVPARSEITIRQLLTHTAGIGYAQIGNRESNAIYSKANVSSGIGVDRDRLLADDMKRLARLPLLHQPGQRYTYGLNTDVLGYLVEVVSGMPLDRFFKTRIFDPLGMNDTYFYLPAAKRNRLVNLYLEKGGRLQKAGDSVPHNGGIFLINYPKMEGRFFSGGAGLSSTAFDYAIFLQMLLNGGEYNGKRLLARNTVRMMTMNQISHISNANPFGLGFGITSEKGSAALPTPEGVYEWGGAFSTTYWVDPKEKLIGIIYRQLWNTSHWDAPNKYKVLVYSAIND